MKIARTVKGLSTDIRFMRFKKRNIDVYITSDKIGATLSLTDGEKMLAIPLEAVKDVIALKERKK